MYDTYNEEGRKAWIKNMHERELTINSRGDTERVPYPVCNPPIFGSEIKRPELTTYEDGLEWNKQAKEHADKALNFNQEYAKRIIEPLGDKVYIINLSDLHWGHHDVDYNFFHVVFFIFIFI